MNSKSLYKAVKEKFKEGDKIVFPESTYDPESGFKQNRRTGIILKLYPRYALVDVKKYRTTVHNHVLLTSKQVKKVNR